MKQVILREMVTLRRFTYGLTQHRADADDLLQSLVEKLLRLELPETDKPVPWMLRVCKNLWIDELRSRKVRAGQEYDEEQALAGTSEIDLHTAMDIQRMRLAIAQLPQEQQHILNLVNAAGLSYAEVADVLGVPIGTVMSRLSRARGALTDMMGREQMNHDE